MEKKLTNSGPLRESVDKHSIYPLFFIREEVRGQRQPTPGEHCDDTLAPECTDQTVEGHGRDIADHRAQLQTETTVGSQQGIAGDVRSHLAIAEDEVRQDRKHRFACRALDTPNSEATEADTGVMGVTCQTPTATTGRLVCQLQAKGQEKGEHAFDKRLAIVKQTKV